METPHIFKQEILREGKFDSSTLTGTSPNKNLRTLCYEHHFILIENFELHPTPQNGGKFHLYFKCS